ncbi:MAG: ABC transporter ATP-binding protein, partial [Candidatus Thorarchaeota archaeon]
MRVVDGVNLSIKEKECVGLLGESGCGKTSLILAALGFFRIVHRFKQSSITEGRLLPFPDQQVPSEAWEQAVSGQSIYRGEDLLSMDDIKRARYLGSHISYIPQGLQGALDPIISIGQQTQEPLEVHKTGDMRQAEMRTAVLEYLNLVRLADADERYVLDPTQFSGGEAQRILIAMALIGGPYLVIADEPTSALDVTVQREVLGVLEMVKDKFDVSLLLVSHDAPVIAEMADRVAIMYSGKIVEVGDAVKMFHEPAHPYTQGLMMSFPRIVMMQMKGGGERLRLRGIPGAPPDLMNLPTGCRFHPRCKHAIELCKTREPEYREVERGHWISCH